MNKLATLFVVTSATACATGHTLVADRDPAAHARVRLELAVAHDSAAVFPSAIDPQLPSVDRIGREVRGTLGDEASAQIELCVAPSGKVAKATLLRGSSFAAFDAALLRDVADWQFSTMPGPANVQTCEGAKITYRPY